MSTSFRVDNQPWLVIRVMIPALHMAALHCGKSTDLDSVLTSDLTWQLSRRTTMILPSTQYPTDHYQGVTSLLTVATGMDKHLWLRLWYLIRRILQGQALALALALGYNTQMWQMRHVTRV
jgi:hypothetical protein